MFQIPLTLESNGPSGSTPSETKLNAVHAGLSELLRLFQIDLPYNLTGQSTLSSLLKTWYPATLQTTVAVEVTLTTLGSTLPTPELSQTDVSLTSLKLAQLPNVYQELALTPTSLTLSINVLKTQ